MSLEVVGALCVAIALIGGGLQIGGVVHVPRLSRPRLIALALIGVVFIAVAVAQSIVNAPAKSAIEHAQKEGQ